MMVVVFAGHLVTGRVARNLHWLEPAFVHQRLDVAIDSGFAEPGMMALRFLQNFVWREWPILLYEGVADSRPLRSLNSSFHSN
jgi:hypothetical protein